MRSTTDRCARIRRPISVSVGRTAYATGTNPRSRRSRGSGRQETASTRFDEAGERSNQSMTWATLDTGARGAESCELNASNRELRPTNPKSSNEPAACRSAHACDHSSWALRSPAGVMLRCASAPLARSIARTCPSPLRACDCRSSSSNRNRSANSRMSRRSCKRPAVQIRPRSCPSRGRCCKNFV